MKKILCVALVLCMLISSTAVFAADRAMEAAQRLKSFNLFEERDADEKVTRAEVASVIIKLITSNAELAVSTEPVFYDVPLEHEMAGEIYYAYQMGWISGVSENSFAPNEPATLQQFLKIATSALGYQSVAENAGGYAGGYYSTGIKIGLLKNLSLTETSGLTIGDVLELLNNMLDAKTLEPIIGTEEFKISEDTLFQQLMERANLNEISGIVQSVGKNYLSKGEELADGKIMIDDKVFYCEAGLTEGMLGMEVTAYYRKSATDALGTVVTLYTQKKFAETELEAFDIISLSETELVYIDENSDTEEFGIEADADFVYNGRIIAKESVTIPKTGTVRLLDRGADGNFDVVFIDEFESFIVDRISENNHMVYFKNDASYRGKTGFWFDFDDKDKEYILENADGEAIEFSDIKVNMVFSVAADISEEIVTVTVSDKTVEGLILSVTTSDYEIMVDDAVYSVYRPDSDNLFSEFKVGRKGEFALNHKGEIVGTVGELYSEGLYAYVTGYSSGRAFGAPKIRVVISGESVKEVEEDGDDEIIKYTYTNGAMAEYEFAEKVSLSVEGADLGKVTASSINSTVFDRAVIYYKLNSEGKINTAEIYRVPEYTTAQLASYYDYSFNGELNSFGGYASKNAFFIGETTQVICIPTVDYPDSDDYTVDVTISDKSNYTIMPVAIDETTQIAECAVLISTMDANTPKPFTDNDKVSIVGGVTEVMDEKGDIYYRLEVLTEEEIEHPLVYEGSSAESVATKLVCGDLIRYNTKANGEIGNIEYLESLSALGDRYFINRESSADEVCYGKAESISLNRLDNLRNERVDQLVLSINSRQKTYVLLREDGPAVYSYNRRTGEIKRGVTDEIAPADRVGDGATDVFMMVNQNDPAVVVILVD